ncbi:MAG: hypothetical protein PF495_20020, partial [Spirochaetales bacterium]|nr:hypothetical protein [Spirochaetales bacterium]
TKLGQEFLSQATQQAAENTRHAFNSLNPEAEKPRQTILEALIWQESLRVLQDHSCLDTRAVIQPMPEEQTLTPFAQQQLQHFNNGQLQSILTLLHSPRPDKGKALLLQTARYLVVRHSLKTKQLYTLDPFPDNARTVQLTEKEMKNEQLTLLQTDLQKQAVKRTRLFFQEINPQEIAYSLLETSRARAWELSQAGEQEHDIRLLPKVKLPSRSKKISLHHFHTEQPGISATSQRLEQKLKTVQKMAKKRYSYNLFYRNCATELIHSLNNSFQDQTTGQTMLGGWMEPNSGFVFIPFLFYNESMTTYPLQDEQVLPARRLRNLEELYANENNVLVWLRESNTLSSTLYEPRSKDTPFLFFTDDSLLLRPIQGILNFGYATLHGVFGIVTLPFDGGQRLHQAGRGMFYSLPEITFSNIRKGSYATGEHLE